MLTGKHTHQLDVLSQALIRQKQTSSSPDEPMAVLFMGQQYDSFPRDLLLDNTITSVDKYAWQRLYIELQQNRNYFPTYDNLQKLWGNLGGLLSRKTVREILSRLVLSGWLSFKVIRGDNGQVAGNVYMLHNTQLSLIEIITQNDESVNHILTSLMSKKDISQSLAILTYNQVKTYLSTREQSDNLFLQMNEGKKEIVITHNIDEIAPSLLVHLENTLSSKNKLSKNRLSSKKELSKKTLSSNLELGENALSSKKELPIKSSVYEASSSTSSSIYSSTTTEMTSKDTLLVIPTNLKARLSEKGLRDITNVICKTEINLALVNKILQSISKTDIAQIKNMTAYLVTNIQKAARGEYNLISNDSPVNNSLPSSHYEQTITVKQVVSKERLNELFNPLKSMIGNEVKK
ncbi:STY4528 family pathogenicity island replication protein [Orbus sturtevantii]|uniref:STY4528 family pathogenicity island replication protein n=1 Tax=Orbus sturtevantii TaxID=3074109 RepID=UPI00370DA2F9